MFVDEKLRNNDPDIRNAIINTEKYLIKYVDEYGELIEQYKNEIPLLGIRHLTFRNQLISDNSLVNRLKYGESCNILKFQFAQNVDFTRTMCQNRVFSGWKSVLFRLKQ